MFYDLNVPIPVLDYGPATAVGKGGSQKKGKNKQSQQQQQKAQAPPVSYTAAQVAEVEARVDLLVHLGYSVLAFNQVVKTKVDGRTHVNTVDALLPHLRKRSGVVYLKRITIVLDEESEKGCGLAQANAPLLSSYDIIALLPTTAGTLSLTCTQHTAPSPFCAHILSLPLTLPRLPFPFKRTLLRGALRNGARVEVCYAGALGGGDPAVVAAGAGEVGSGVGRAWWAAAREAIRVAGAKGIVVSGGAAEREWVRAPRDVANLITLLGVAQDAAHNASTQAVKSLILRAQTRKTYRAILSEPKLVIPESFLSEAAARASSSQAVEPAVNPTDSHVPLPTESTPEGVDSARRLTESSALLPVMPEVADAGAKKRPRESGAGQDPVLSMEVEARKVDNNDKDMLPPLEKQAATGSEKPVPDDAQDEHANQFGSRKKRKKNRDKERGQGRGGERA